MKPRTPAAPPAHMLRRFLRRHAAFTLVELLVVIAIIVVLIALLLPSLARARAQAKLVGCMANHRQIVLALFVYSQTNNNVMPFADYWDATGNEHSWAAPIMAGSYLGNTSTLAYAVNTKVLYCTEITPQQIGYYPKGYYSDQAVGIGVNRWASYGVAGPFSNPTIFYYPWYNNSGPQVYPSIADGSGGRKVSAMPPNTVILADTAGYHSEQFQQLWWNQYGWASSINTFPQPLAWVEYRHMNKTVVSFVDGHADTFALTNPSNPSSTTQGLYAAYLQHQVTLAP